MAPVTGGLGWRLHWDNAVSEGFFGTLKQELVFRIKLQSRAATRTAIFEYIEGYYNSRRATPH